MKITFYSSFWAMEWRTIFLIHFVLLDVSESCRLDFQQLKPCLKNIFSHKWLILNIRLWKDHFNRSTNPCDTIHFLHCIVIYLYANWCFLKRTKFQINIEILDACCLNCFTSVCSSCISFPVLLFHVYYVLELLSGVTMYEKKILSTINFKKTIIYQPREKKLRDIQFITLNLQKLKRQIVGFPKNSYLFYVYL